MHNPSGYTQNATRAFLTAFRAIYTSSTGCHHYNFYELLFSRKTEARSAEERKGEALTGARQRKPKV